MCRAPGAAGWLPGAAPGSWLGPRRALLPRRGLLGGERGDAAETRVGDLLDAMTGESA